MNRADKQNGISLIIVLIMIAILTGIMMSLNNTPKSDLKIAANTQDQSLAQQAANEALQEAIGWIKQIWNNSAALPTGTCQYPNSLPMHDNTFSLNDYNRQPISWWSTNGCQASASSTPAGVAAAPQYILKQLGCDATNNQFIYQIIARGVGHNANTVAYVEKIINIGSNGNLTNINSSTPGAKAVTLSGPGMTTFMSQAGISNPIWIPLGGQKSFGGGWSNWAIQACGCCCPSGQPLSFGCERDCQGRLRIVGTSECGCNVPNVGNVPGCSTQYGPWVPASGGTSSIQMCVQYPPNYDNNGYSTNPATLQTYSCSQ